MIIMQTRKFISFEQSPSWFRCDISIHYCHFSAEDYKDQLFAYHQIPFPSTLEKAVIKRRAEFLAGRYCAHKSLLSFEHTNINIDADNHGCPLWPSKITGSISHSNTRAVAATSLKSNYRGIGIDIENIIDHSVYQEIKEQILFDKEHQIIKQAQGELSASLLFTIIFSVKESFFKAAYPEVKRYFDFSSVSILRIDQKNKTILIQVNKTLSENLAFGKEILAEYRILPDENVVTIVTLKSIPPCRGGLNTENKGCDGKQLT